MHVISQQFSLTSPSTLLWLINAFRLLRSFEIGSRRAAGVDQIAIYQLSIASPRLHFHSGSDIGYEEIVERARRASDF